MSWTSPSSSAGAFGSWTAYGGAFGSAVTSAVGAGPPWLSPSDPAAVEPLIEIVPVMPASEWPGIEHRNARPSAGTVTLPVAV